MHYLTGQNTVKPQHFNLLLIYEAVGMRIADVTGTIHRGSSGLTLRLSVFTKTFRMQSTGVVFL